MDIVGYVKDHPYATGTIVIVGGLIFYLIVAGGSTQPVATGPSGPSDAQVMADASIQQARIAAGAAAGESAAAIKAAEIGAGVKLKSDELAAQVATTSLQYQRDISLGLADRELMQTKIQSESNYGIATLGFQTDLAKTGLLTEAQIQTDRLAANVALAESDNTRLMFEKAQNTIITTNGYQADNINRSISAGVETARLNNEALITNTALNTNALIESNRIAAEADKVLAGINASTTNNIINASIMKDQIGAAVTTTQINASRDIITNTNNSNTAIELANINKDTVLGQGIITVQNNAITAQAETDRLAIEASKSVDLAYAQSAENIQVARLNFAQEIAPDLKRKDRDDVAQAAITGETYYKQNTSSTIADIGGALAGAGQLAGAVVPFL